MSSSANNWTTLEAVPNSIQGPTSNDRNINRNRNDQRDWRRNDPPSISGGSGRGRQNLSNQRCPQGNNKSHDYREDYWRTDEDASPTRQQLRGRGGQSQNQRGQQNSQGQGRRDVQNAHRDRNFHRDNNSVQNQSMPQSLMNFQSPSTFGSIPTELASSSINPFSISSLNPDAPSFQPRGFECPSESSSSSSRTERYHRDRDRPSTKSVGVNSSQPLKERHPHPHQKRSHKETDSRGQHSRGSRDNFSSTSRDANARGRRNNYYEYSSNDTYSKEDSTFKDNDTLSKTEDFNITFNIKKKPDIRNQRESLMDQLEKNAYDCMICVERVRRFNPVWACGKCYNVFHLNCLRKWANSSVDEVGWRCPGCQTYSEVIPSDYKCFCGAVKNPSANISDVPHCCGQTCGKPNVGGIDCIHSCTIPCHPGPCPACEAVIQRNCSCGKTVAQVKCSSKSVLTCGQVCDKFLCCFAHKCTRPCHTGPCDPCSVVINLECFCGSLSQDFLCTEESSQQKGFSCSKPCNKKLNCKNHSCTQDCHSGLCKPCKMSPEAVLSCPCGQTPIAEACLKSCIPLRKSCMDKIPTCGKTCRKILPCGGSANDVHSCLATCHTTLECPPCPLKSLKKCRCGNKIFEIPCIKFKPREEVLCEKKCQKKRNCGKHKCNTKCCIDPDHICPIVCDRQLRCGNHNCALLCHNGHCPPCRNVSFEELACECGQKVIYPPVPCGTKPPLCQAPCLRAHECDHPVMHHCHSEQFCPPCTVLTQKWCNGKHELRKNVMCHIKQLSCGMPCRKPVSCGKHICIRTCHIGECLAPQEICMLPCEIPKECGHKCAAPCHKKPPCPEIRCKIITDVTCECGRKKDTMICWKREREYDRLVTYLMNIEMKRLRDVEFDKDSIADKKGEINQSSVLAEIKGNTPKTNVLECDKECARVERNRKLVEALQLKDPDVTSSFGTPNYSEFLVNFTKKNPQFVEMIHERLTSIVLKAKKSQKKNETYGFESMNRDKRHVVHEYSDYFGCISESFDLEPNRNVICTASKEKSYIPAVSLIDAVFRPNMKTERKNLFEEVEIVQNSKSHIMRPANGKIGNLSSPKSGMVALSIPATPAWNVSTGNVLNSGGATMPGLDFPSLR